MKRLVLASWEDDSGFQCVDILAHGDGSFGYSLCRRDPEDPHGWRHIGDPEARRFDTREAAETAARVVAPWAQR